MISHYHIVMYVWVNRVIFRLGTPTFVQNTRNYDAVLAVTEIGVSSYSINSDRSQSIMVVSSITITSCGCNEKN